ncbi:MAG: hypothetical protein IPK83_20300 [Planctomycetes bacterium]|nr:hypothetical protein [Planctomycetota bacterium]
MTKHRRREMTKERVIESQDLQTVLNGAERRKAVDPYDWPWWGFAVVVYGCLGLTIALLMGWL